MRKGLDGFYVLCGALSAGLIVLICGVVFVQVLFNFITKAYGMISGGGIALSVSSYNEIAGYLLASASFLALPYTFRKGGHIRMTLFHHAVSSKIRLVFDVLCVALAVAVSVYLTYDLFRLTYDSFQFDDLSEGIVKIPLWLPQAVMTAGMGAMVIAGIDALFELAMGRQDTLSSQKEPTGETEYSS